MDANDDFYGKGLNLNCFYMHTIFGQKYPKTTIHSEFSDFSFIEEMSCFVDLKITLIDFLKLKGFHIQL